MSYGAELGIHAYPGGGLRGGDRSGRRGSKGAVVASDP